MRVDRPAKVQGVLEQDVLGGVAQMLLAANHVGDGHQLIVDDHGKVIGGVAVGLQDDEVVKLGARDVRLAPHHVGDRDLAGVGNFQPHDVRTFLIEVAADGGGVELQRRAIVAVGPSFIAGAGTGCLEHGRRLERRVGGARSVEPIRVPAVQIQSLGLAIGPRLSAPAAVELRALVPPDTQPRQVLEEGLRGGLRGSFPIGVLDAKDESAPFGPGIGPAEQCGPGAADMEVPRRAGREPASHHGRDRLRRWGAGGLALFAGHGPKGIALSAASRSRCAGVAQRCCPLPESALCAAIRRHLATASRTGPERAYAEKSSARVSGQNQINNASRTTRRAT